jgi:hypothetical protein
LADLIVFALGDIYLVDKFFELIQGQGLVELNVDVHLGDIFLLAFSRGLRLFALDYFVDGRLENIALTIFGDFIEEFSILGLECADLIEVVFLDGLQPFDLILEKFFLLNNYLCNFSFASVSTGLENIGHRFKGLSDMIVNPFDDRSDALVEVVEIGNKFDEAEVDQGILAADDAIVDLILP